MAGETITITAGPSNWSLGATNNRDDATFTFRVEPQSIWQSVTAEEGDVIIPKYEFTSTLGNTPSTVLYDGVWPKGQLEIDNQDNGLSYAGFCCVGTYNLQMHLYNKTTGQIIATSNTWTWSVTA